MLILIICIGMLMYLCMEGKTLMRLNAEVRYPRENENIYLERRDGDALYISGEGVLYGSDMMALVEGEGDKNDIRHIIIGDGITEIGYDAIDDFEGLQTLWLGRDVEIADKGSIKGCTSLRYVFLPQGFRKCGRDFLYNCGKCVVVTDGPAESLPALRNVRTDRIVADVDSYDALAAASDSEAELPEALKRWWP